MWKKSFKKIEMITSNFLKVDHSIFFFLLQALEVSLLEVYRQRSERF